MNGAPNFIEIANSQISSFVTAKKCANASQLGGNVHLLIYVCVVIVLIEVSYLFLKQKNNKFKIKLVLLIIVINLPLRRNSSKYIVST